MSDARFTIEVLMAAYNNPVATRLALESFSRQTDQEFSLVVADDGSGPEIKALADEYAARGMAVRHVWHEDRGFRKSMILNLAAGTSCADYLVFVDNDCMSPRTFIADHRAAARRGHFMVARRVDLGPELTEEFRAGKWELSVLDSRVWLIRQAVMHRLRHAEHGLRLPWWLVRRWRREGAGILGANMAVWREDMLLVNGFDNNMREGAGEDIDLEWRLRAAGIKATSMFGRGGNVHLFHGRTRRVDPAAREYRLQKVLRNDLTVHGIREVCGGA